MASYLNDRVVAYTATGPVNLYDNQMCIGTAHDKCLAASLGGHDYNIISNKPDKHYFPLLRNSAHYLDTNNVATNHFWPRMKRDPNWPGSHSSIEIKSSLDSVTDKTDQGSKLATRMAHIKHPYDYASYVSELDDPNRRASTSESISARTTRVIQPLVVPLKQWRPSSVNEDVAPMKRIPWEQKTYGIENGRHISRQRVANSDFSITRNNNHFSGQCKLTRADPFFAAPVAKYNQHSVTYDIINHKRRDFACNTTR